MKFNEMLKNLLGQDTTAVDDDQVIVDQVLDNDDFDGNLIAAWDGFK